MTIVLKLGSSLVVDADLNPRDEALDARAREVAALRAAGERVVIVSSGAIALGLPLLGLTRRPKSMPKLQAASAVGQARLQAAWSKALGRHDLRAGQVLLTAGDIASRDSYVNVRNTLQTLLRLGIVPIVNENDATATSEIAFGDNDTLAAQVAVLLQARLLVLLTEVEGVFTRVPGALGAELVRDGRNLTDVDFAPSGSLGSGGMESKVVAARMAASAGITTVIAGGHGAAVLESVVAGEAAGTYFEPDTGAAPAFKLWLRYALPSAGRIAVDEGARRAIVESGASLLAVGVTGAEGGFRRGDAVELVGPDGSPFAKGLAGLAASEIGGGGEVVHRDRLVLYAT
jgi:glutamate 5-kinase